MSFEPKVPNQDENLEFSEDNAMDTEYGPLEYAMFNSDALSNKNFFSEMLEAVKNGDQFYNIKFTNLHSNNEEFISSIKFMIQEFE